MPGIYVHVPFCKRACHYCNFHFSTSMKLKEEMVRALCTELELRKDFLADQTVESIYFGGGTPSILTGDELGQILETIDRNYTVGPSPEITLEANPDDLTADKLKWLQRLNINRLSIGVQSFHDQDLKWMNRVHSADDAVRGIQLANDAGFENISIDLIYGLPTTTRAMWESNVEKAVALGIPHLSCYCLTVEPKTALAHFVKTGKVKIPDDEMVVEQFIFVMDYLERCGFQHYEISNFAKPGMHSKHNTSYWLGEKYLGIGPSAHSYDGERRYWNVSNNAQYVKAIGQGVLPNQSERLEPKDRYNEYVMTSLRTSWGCDLNKVRQLGDQFYEYLITNVWPFVDRGLVKSSLDRLTLTRKGKLLADYIEAELFWVE